MIWLLRFQLTSWHANTILCQADCRKWLLFTPSFHNSVETLAFDRLGSDRLQKVSVALIPIAVCGIGKYPLLCADLTNESHSSQVPTSSAFKPYAKRNCLAESMAKFFSFELSCRGPLAKGNVEKDFSFRACSKKKGSMVENTDIATTCRKNINLMAKFTCRDCLNFLELQNNKEKVGRR